MITEICNECGQSVQMGTGLFVNRVLDLNNKRTRIKMGKPFPEGDFVCIICDEKLSQENLRKHDLRNQRIAN
jgi:hypothetical protein